MEDNNTDPVIILTDCIVPEYFKKFRHINGHAVKHIRWAAKPTAELCDPVPLKLILLWSFEKIQTSRINPDSIKSETQKTVNSLLNEKDLLQNWEEIIVVLIYGEGQTRRYNHYQRLSILSTTNIIESNILPP
jgi:hypothetical protein